MDAVRTSKRLGAEKAYLVYRRSREEMPAREEEIHHAEQEGIEFLLLTAPLSILGDKNNWVCGMECQKMELGEPDESGRRRPVPVKGSEFTLELQTVIEASDRNRTRSYRRRPPGSKRANGEQSSRMRNRRRAVRGYSPEGIFPRGGATVILAMKDGKAPPRRFTSI